MMSADVRRLLWVRALRAFGDGYVSLLLPVYLLALGLSPFEVGVITTGTLLGSGVLTLVVGLHAHRYRYRTLLLAATALMTATGLGFAAITQFWPLLVVAFVGTLNPSSGDVSIFLPLEQAVLARIVVRQAADGGVRALQPCRRAGRSRRCAVCRRPRMAGGRFRHLDAIGDASRCSCSTR